MAGITDQAMISRVEAIEAFIAANKIPGPQGIGERNLAKTFLDMEIYVSTLINNPPYTRKHCS